MYGLPPTNLLAVATSSISTAEGTAANVIATTNGTLVIKVTPGLEFPKYGGEMSITIPDWYDGGTESVFSLNPSPTICSAPDAVIKIATQQTSNKVHTIIFTSYTPGSEIVLTCSNYRNPIYASTIAGFQMTIRDLETPNNLVAIYPAWGFTIATLLPRALPLPLKLALYEQDSDEPSLNPVPIQTDVGISIEFEMGEVPIDGKGCYVKYTFPNDVPLPATILRGGYQSFSALDYRMMYSSSNGINLKRDVEYFIRDQAFAAGNYIVVKGCTMRNVVGRGQKARVKFTGVLTPAAQKTTNLFKVEVYKEFDPQSYTLTHLMVTATGSIPQDRFTSGTLTNGVFSGLVKTI